MSHQKLHQKGRALLNSYFTLKLTTKDIITHYLGQFEEINEVLKKINGPGNLNIIKFPEDKQGLDCLPDTLTVYRGYREHDKREGISWSLSRRVAELFAYDATIIGARDGLATELNVRIGTFDGKELCGNRYSKEDLERLPNLLIVGECDRADVLAYTNRRREQEIIINPAKVRDIQELPVSERHIVIPTDDYEVCAEPLEWLLANKQH